MLLKLETFRNDVSSLMSLCCRQEVNCDTKATVLKLIDSYHCAHNFFRVRTIFFEQNATERQKRRDWLAEKIGFELMVAFSRTIVPYWPTKCVFCLSAANGKSKPRIGQTGQWRIAVRNQCILRPFPVPACLQSCVVGTQPRVRIQSSPPASLLLLILLSTSRRNSIPA